MNPSFTALPLKNGLLYSDEYDAVDVYGLVGQNFFHCERGTYFVFVYRGIAWANSEFPIYKGMYACLNSGLLQSDAYCRAIVVHSYNYNGMRSFGGPVEREGRLKYIDGCTDSLLIPPVKLGDPCLNHLHFPPDISQTMHTHPSIRIGLVYKGNGECVTPWGNIDLVEGMAFVIHPENNTLHEGHLVGSHCFRTGDNSMDVIAYHPDSDFGPTDEEHPMLNRTMVDGVSAKYIEKIKTK